MAVDPTESRTIRMHAADTVAIVANDLGSPAERWRLHNSLALFKPAPIT